MRWFRRRPAATHLDGRTPTDCGYGRISSGGLVGLVAPDDWTPPSDDVGRAFLASAPPLAMHLRAMAAARDLFKGALPDGWMP